MRLGKVWYASHQRAMSLWKLLAFDDVGMLLLEGGILGFTGRKYDFEIDDVRSVSVTPIRVAWGLMIPSLLASVLLVPCVPLPCYILVVSDNLTARVIGWIIIGLIIGSLYLYLAIRLPYLWRTPWVRIEHGIPSGGVTYSYFALCGESGRSVRRQETRELAKRLQTDLEAGQLARHFPDLLGPTPEGIQEL